MATTVLLKLRGRSDAARWSMPANLFASWDARTETLASLVPPGSSVLEFGAGRQVLVRYLPERCIYTPSDLVDRGNGTIVCDLNAGRLPPFPYHDVVVFGGVLEYVHDLPRLIRHLAGCCREIVASYAVTDLADQASVITRRQHGWVNDFNSRELEALFRDHGFRRTQLLVWKGQHLFRFVRVTVGQTRELPEGGA